MVVTQLREACAQVAERARLVQINTDSIAPYAASLPPPLPAQGPVTGDRAERARSAAYWLTLDAINFGSGWFPTLRKRPGASGYGTVSSGLRRRFDTHGPWSAAELSELTPAAVAGVLAQDPEHELIGLFAASLNELGHRLESDYGADPLALIDAAGGSASAFVELLAPWDCFRDVSPYGDLAVPFYKRAQIAAADLARAGAASFADLESLTMFADNLVPHVLRLDGILDFDPGLVQRIEAEQLLEHGSPEEVEIRACALHAVELIVAASGAPASATSSAPVSAAQLDQLLWQRGQSRLYKGSPRHRSRSTAY